MAKDKATQIVEAALVKHPDLPTQTLAKLIYSQHGGVFSGVESIRKRIRYRRGQDGKRNLATRAPELAKFDRPAGKQGDRSNVFDRIPEPIEQLTDWDPTPIKGTKALVISDLHIPYHDRDAVRIALEEGYRRDCDTVILNGDIMDCYKISRWQTDPAARNMSGEIDDVIAFLSVVRDAWPDAEIVFSVGNHEERWEAFMRQKAPELLGIPDFELPSILKLSELSIKYIGGRYYGKFGKLPVLHGHEFGRSVFSPVNPARGYYLRSKESMLAGHYHRSSSHSEKSLSGKIVTTVSTGCLCGMHPEYAPVNGWNLGFAIVEILDEDGNYTVDNRKIIAGRTFSA